MTAGRLITPLLLLLFVLLLLLVLEIPKLSLNELFCVIYFLSTEAPTRCPIFLLLLLLLIKVLLLFKLVLKLLCVDWLLGLGK